MQTRRKNHEKKRYRYPTRQSSPYPNCTPHTERGEAGGHASYECESLAIARNAINQWSMTTTTLTHKRGKNGMHGALHEYSIARFKLSLPIPNVRGKHPTGKHNPSKTHALEKFHVLPCCRLELGRIHTACQMAMMSCYS